MYLHNKITMYHRMSGEEWTHRPCVCRWDRAQCLPLILSQRESWLQIPKKTNIQNNSFYHVCIGFLSSKSRKEIIFFIYNGTGKTKYIMYSEIPLSNKTKSFFFILQLLANASCSCNLRRIRMYTFVKLSNRIVNIFIWKYFR